MACVPFSLHLGGVTTLTPAYFSILLPPQAIVLCEAETTEFLSWPNTPAGTTESLHCPSSTSIINRTCNSTGVWEFVDLSLCTIFSSINIVSVSVHGPWHRLSM